MKTEELLSKISGMQTLESIKKALGVDSSKAIYFIHRLRKKGFVKTEYTSDKKRVYRISQTNVLGGTDYTAILNKHSPVKLSTSEVYRIYGRKVSIEETIVYAVKTHKVRYALACLALFRKIKNWPRLYKLAKKNNLTREIGALYDVSVKIIPKVKRIDKRFRNNAIPKKGERYRYIAQGFKSNDYKDIEKKWKIYLPFNKTDLEVYK